MTNDQRRSICRHRRALRAWQRPCFPLAEFDGLSFGLRVSFMLYDAPWREPGLTLGVFATGGIEDTMAIADKWLEETRQMWQRYSDYLKLPYGPQQPGQNADYEALQSALAHRIPDLLGEIDKINSRLAGSCPQCGYRVTHLVENKYCGACGFDVAEWRRTR